MKCPFIPPNENERLRALGSYGLGGSRPLPSLDPVVRVAARMFGTPAAAVNMIGSDHVFFAASTGIGTVDMSREASFCAHAITQNDVMVVPDARLDERFHDNPLVIGSANLRFYAGVPLLSPEGHALGALCVIDSQPREFSEEDRARLRELAKMAMDRLELRRLEMSTEQAQRPFEEFARHSPTAVVWFNAQREIVAWNKAAAALHGYDLKEGHGELVDALIPERERSAFRKLVEQAVAAGTFDQLPMPTSIHGLRKDGTEFELGLSLFCWKDRGQLVFNAHLQDITARKREEKELLRLATTDILTGLANRARFYRSVEEALAKSASVAVVMIDLDGFKDVNDTLGHTVGDDILCEVARRLESALGSRGLVARIGGDEFGLLLQVDTPEQAHAVAQSVIDRVAEAIRVDAHAVRVTASCGIAVAPLHAQEALELIGNADLALFHAKRLGGATAFVFVQALRMEAVARHLYGLGLHRAVHEGEFVLFYQPQVRLSDGALAGAEALIRWRHPERGLLSPAAFLPALENGPLAATVGAWVLDEACAQTALWRRRGAGNFRISVNLFGAQFRVDDLAAHVISALERHGLPPQALELEITENIVLNHDDVVLQSLRLLREHGVGVAFDDFGTGFASLSLLKRYPLSRIKIDRSFVQNMLESGQDTAVIRAVLDMAKAFSLETIAEGVETNEQCSALRQVGCTEGQGYLFARPLPAAEFAETFGILPPITLSRHA
ncbi:putative bifunctional diguanylate cyclase/phosphodiesterase [Dyella sp. KULCS107]|uniref:putative bifunctional diguanylate cyclase/phosphodiesterase n=1 Tax=Dyella sp. KULCS107 TaxID=3422216 RepID=UPI003D6E555A